MRRADDLRPLPCESVIRARAGCSRNASAYELEGRPAGADATACSEPAGAIGWIEPKTPGGAFAGKSLDVNGVKQLANIPSKEVLLAQLCGLLMSPISRTAVVLGALAKKKEEPASGAAPAAA